MRKSNPAKANLWMERIMACRQSGLSDSRWCRENDIAPSSLYYWIKNLRMEASVISAPNHDVAIPFKQDVVPLRVTRDVQIPDTNSSAATAIIKGTYDLDPFSNALLSFCGRRGDTLSMGSESISGSRLCT